MTTQIRINPSDAAAIAAFQEMTCRPMEKEEISIVEMTDETARNVQLIWSSIESFSHIWRGEMQVHVPHMPMDRKEFWGSFAIDHAPELLPVIEPYVLSVPGEGKMALDLGCGKSPATTLLLERGWRVTAIDSSPKALEALAAKHKKEVESGRLTIVEADITSYTPEKPAELVIAADILPYINPAQFRSTWIKIHDTFVKKNGIFIGSLFRSIPNLIFMNMQKEMGAWHLWDRRMVRPLLTSVGYDIKTCQYRQDTGIEPICIQFVAQKM